MPSFTVRTATPADARAIAEGRADARESERGLMPDSYVDFFVADRVEPRIVKYLANGRPTLVAEVDGEVVGYAAYERDPDDDTTIQLDALYIRPSAWRRGIGRALVDEMVARLRNQGETSMKAWVIETSTNARAFYEAIGWTRDGTREPLGDTDVYQVAYRKLTNLNP